jgi:cytoskeletal protein RodZ
MAKKRKNKLVKVSKPLLVLVLVLALSLGAYALLNHNHDDSTKPASKPSSSPNNNINYGPPSNAEKQETQAHKDALAQDSPPAPPPTSSGKKAVTPIITSTEGNQIYAYVPGVFEDGGTCTATFTQGAQKPIVKTSKGFANATYTSCSPISGPAGTWTVVVSYSSSTAEGSSRATEIK